MPLSAQKTEERRRRILDAACNLFAKKDIVRTTMEDIARVAGCTRRTLYAYFRSREEIYLLLYHEDLADRWEEQKTAMAAAGDAPGKLSAWAHTYHDRSRRNPQSLRLQLHWDYHGLDTTRIDPELFEDFRRKNDEVADGLRAVVRIGIAEGSLRPDLRVDLCVNTLILTLRVVLNRALFPGYSFAAFDADTYVHHYIDLFLRGIVYTEENGDEHNYDTPL